MDLGAYINIDNLAELAKENGIYVPRLRGYRLMKDELPVEINKELNFDYEAYHCIEKHFIKEAIKMYTRCQLGEFSRTKNKAYASRYVILYTDTDKCVSKYYNYYSNDKNKPFPWHKFHGKLRKKLKLLYKQCLRKTKSQYDTWNKYCGREDILYIHARIGGLNWSYFDGAELEKKAWFLEKVDDAFDDTYCDIYAKLDKH